MKYFVGVDLGTQSMKALLFSPEGNVVCGATACYLPDYPIPGWAENDTSCWIHAMSNVIASLKRQSGIHADDIGCVAVDAQNGGVVPVDRDCNPLGKCIIWLDRRSENQMPKLNAILSDRDSLEAVGAVLHSGLALTKIMWYRENYPDIYEKAWKFVEIAPFMVGYLTGCPLIDYGNATWTLMYDYRRKKWSETILDAAGIDLAKLSEVGNSDDIAGTVLPERAEEIGLSKSTKVAVGGGDLQAGMIGCGLIGTGSILDIAGTANIVATYTDSPVLDEKGIFGTHLTMIPGLWSLEQGNMASGACIRWYKDTLGRESYEKLDGDAMDICPGSEGIVFLPYLTGAVTPKEIGYARGSFFGLTLSHTIPHLTHAVYEGCSFGLKDCIERLKEMGYKNSKIYTCGGGVKSKLWCQMKADVLCEPITTIKNSSDSAQVGIGIIAGVAQGNFSSIRQGVECLVETGKVYEPDAQKTAQYLESYSFYKECAKNFEDLYRHYR